VATVDEVRSLCCGTYDIYLSSHLDITGIMCRHCGLEEETGWHLLLDCPALWQVRLNKLGADSVRETFDQLRRLCCRTYDDNYLSSHVDIAGMMCRHCGLEEETGWNLLLDYPALWQVRLN